MYTLPTLPYSYDALEPYIDAKTMEIHYTKHHQGYIDNLNAALEKHANLFSVSLQKLLSDLEEVPEDIRVAVRNNGGGDYNHTLFWRMMKKNGGGVPQGKIGQEIIKVYGTFDRFKEHFSTAAKSRFGSGWAWLCVDKRGKLCITSTANQDTPLAQKLQPIVGLDVWEHAYYLKYHNKRVDYIAAWWHVVNWETVEELYTTL